MRAYLAGPEVFLPNAREILDCKIALTRSYGFTPVSPGDLSVPETETRRQRGLAISALNEKLMSSADLIIANLTPFRGISADVGTVFELGFFVGQGKPAFAYSHEASDLLTRFRRSPEAVYDTDSRAWRDALGMSVEDFGNADNLMIDACLAEQGRIFHRLAVPPEERFRAMDGFIACLKEAQSTFAAQGCDPAPAA